MSYRDADRICIIYWQDSFLSSTQHNLLKDIEILTFSAFGRFFLQNHSGNTFFQYYISKKAGKYPAIKLLNLILNAAQIY